MGRPKFEHTSMSQKFDQGPKDGEGLFRSAPKGHLAPSSQHLPPCFLDTQAPTPSLQNWKVPVDAGGKISCLTQERDYDMGCYGGLHGSLACLVFLIFFRSPGSREVDP